MRVFKLRSFSKAAMAMGVDDDRLRIAVREIEAGKVDAMLGSGAIKQRVARPGGGKSGGARTIVAFRSHERCVFMQIFAKNELQNISAGTLSALRIAAEVLLAMKNDQVSALLRNGNWVEVEYEGHG